MIWISIKSSLNSLDIFYMQQKKQFQRVQGNITLYWNDNMYKLHNDLNTARDIAYYVPTSEHNTALKQVNARFIRARNDARRKC